MLELTVAGGQNSGIYFGEDNWSDYRMEVKARKLVGPYFHLFVRTQEPAVDFYFMEISYNSHTTSIFMFSGGGLQMRLPAVPVRNVLIQRTTKVAIHTL